MKNDKMIALSEFKEVPNIFLEINWESLNYNLHNFDVPFRSLVIALSGSGKSTFSTNSISVF
jgi:hypothetical protein